MLRPIITLDLPSTTITDLQKKGFYYVEDLLKNEDCLKKFDLNRSMLEKQLNVPGTLALDVWQRDTQRQSILVCCSELEAVLGNGFQCGVITELSGAPFSGKTQICLQLSISVQLNKCHGGLNGRAIYIDTRSGVFGVRLRDIIRGYNKLFKDLKLNENEALNNIHVLAPHSMEDFLQIIDCVGKVLAEEVQNDKKTRLIVVDSLSMPILCCIDDPLKRPYYFSKILSALHKLALKHDLAVVITNEIVTQVDKDGTPYFAPAGGQHVADYVHVKMESTKLTDDKFAIRLVKSPMMPEISITFKITQDGIRSVS